MWLTHVMCNVTLRNEIRMIKELLEYYDVELCLPALYFKVISHVQF